ncbi:MAG: YidC/Oxa1 family membrane protein insertase [Tenericutes bacterium]|nr:YidC/Oxa1 family membrane protein insertase [Mycoplasmatota bacterium]
MKNIKKILIVLVLTVMLTTGCTRSFKDKETNTVYTENILCKPTNKESLKAYESNENVDLDKLPNCENLKVNSGGYEGLWTSLLVKPLAWVIVKVGLLVKNYGLSIIILGILLRLLVLPLSMQTMNMSTGMQKANPELQRLEKKYVGRNDQQSLMAKNQEMLMIYKKYNIKPFSGCLVSLIQLPLFFAFLEAIQRIPAILEEKLLWFDLGTTPWKAITSGNYYYIIIVILIGASTYFSFKNAGMTSVNEAQAQQTKMMTKMMTVFIIFMSFTLNVGIGLYWVSTSAFAILQNFILKKARDKKEK